MKLYLYITDADQYIRGEYSWSLGVSDRGNIHESGTGSWILAGSGEFDINVDEKTVMQTAVDAIEKTEQKTRAEFELKMGMLKEKKANLLSITHQPLSVV